jgi:hypothetical protein
MTMLLITAAFFTALVVIACAPDTPLGKALRNLLVDVPARMLNRLTPFEVTIGLIVFAWLIAMALVAPELIAMVGGIGDLAICLDAAVLVMLLGTMTRLKLVITQTVRLGRAIGARLDALSSRSRAGHRSSRQRRLRGAPSSDDADSPSSWAFA